MSQAPDHAVRLFAHADQVARLANDFLAGRLTRAAWTHEAHLAVCLWLIRERPDLDLSVRLPALIRAHNIRVGTPNDDHGGFHATLTQFYIAEIQAHHRDTRELPLVDAVNQLLASPRGRRDWPLRHYRRDRLFSVAARRAYMPPDRPPSDPDNPQQ